MFFLAFNFKWLTHFSEKKRTYTTIVSGFYSLYVMLFLCSAAQRKTYIHKKKINDLLYWPVLLYWSLINLTLLYGITRILY